jgi:protein SCO1/2
MFWKRIVIVISVFVFFACRADHNASESNAEIEPDIASLPYYNSPDFTPHWNVESPDTFHAIAPFNFINQNGSSITEKTFEDKIYLVNFFFTACGSICPKMMRNMETVQDHFAENEDVLLVSHTVMPSMDSVATLKKYESNFNVIENKWHFVTGVKSELYNLARTSYFVEEEPGYTKDSTEFLHTEHFVLVDKNKHLRGIYNGTVELEMERVIEDIDLLLKEN